MTVIAICTAFCIGFLAARVSRRKIDPSTSSWTELPSGWAKTIDADHSAYAIQLSKTDAHWWISRNGRTWIEGPAQSIEMAKKEIEVVVSDFMS